MKNKVLHISHTDIRFDNRILKELKALESINDIQLLAYGIEGDEGNKYNSLSSDYIKTFTLVTKRAKFLSRALRYPLNIIEAFFKLTIPAIKYRPTIIHCHDTLFLPIALIIKLVTKAKLVYDAHELESNKSGQSKLLSRYSLFFEKITWKHINLLITVSDSIITWYNNKFGEKDSLLILNSPEIGKSTTSKGNYLREKFTIPIDKKIFLYLGIITKGRGIDLYLDVFKKNNIDSHVVFMGYGVYVDKIKDASKQYSNIHYHDSVRHDRVVEISNSADVGLCMIENVSLSDYYCLPNKLFEYAFSGLYVLCSDFPDMRQLVEKYSLGVCASLNVDDIYKAVKILEKDTINIETTDLRPLSWEFQAEKLVLGYKKLLNV